MYTPRVVDDVVVVVSATVDASNGSHVLQMHGLAFYTTTTSSDKNTTFLLKKIF